MVVGWFGDGWALSEMYSGVGCCALHGALPVSGPPLQARLSSWTTARPSPRRWGAGATVLVFKLSELATKYKNL
eukprot:COSAG06_NODE_67059_length_253_cov_0.409091_1_plen_73_part_10